MLHSILPQGSVPADLATLSLAIAIGIALGNICVYGVRLGVAAVLFSALLFGQLGLSLSPSVLQYFRDFALILFVYTIGMQMGPGFLASLRAEGVRLNFLTAATLILGAMLSGAAVIFTHMPRDLAAGLFTGGFATTPALAAAQDAMHQIANLHHVDPTSSIHDLNLAYSVAYPFGLTGPILIVILFRVLFRVDVKKELADLLAERKADRPELIIADIEITNATCDGATLRGQQFLSQRGVLISRVLRDGVQWVPKAATKILLGDIVRAFGPKAAIDQLIPSLGKLSSVNLSDIKGDIERQHLLVTRPEMLGRSLRDLDLINRHGVTLSRVTRAGVELPARADLKLQFGDSVTAVGPSEGLKSVEQELGNSTDAMNYTQLIPIFLGIWLGVIVGSIPLPTPGSGAGLRIGLAGGPLLVAIILARIGRIGPVIWYMPIAATQLLRDFGMAVFLACVGFQSGDHFIQKIMHGGVPLIAWGAAVTLVPMTLVALIARLGMKMNFVTLSGLISGAMTSSPTLMFSNETTQSNDPAVAYAAVYPLSVLLPVFCSQLLVTFLMK